MNIKKQKNSIYTKLALILIVSFSLIGCEKDPTKEDEKKEEVVAGQITVNNLPDVTGEGSQLVGYYLQIYPSGADIYLNESHQRYITTYPIAKGQVEYGENVFRIYKLNDQYPNDIWAESGTNIVLVLSQKRFCGQALNHIKATIPKLTNGSGTIDYSEFKELKIKKE